MWTFIKRNLCYRKSLLPLGTTPLTHNSLILVTLHITRHCFSVVLLLIAVYTKGRGKYTLVVTNTIESTGRVNYWSITEGGGQLVSQCAVKTRPRQNLLNSWNVCGQGAKANLEPKHVNWHVHDVNVFAFCLVSSAFSPLFVCTGAQSDSMQALY